MPGPTPPLPGTPRLTCDEVRARDLALDAASAAHPAGALKPGTQAANAVAVVGQDGHMFIGDGANRWERQFRGELTVPDAWLSDWAGVFLRRAEQAAALGVTLCNLVIPEKQVVHPDLRWPAGDVTGETRPLKLLLPRLPTDAIFYAAQPLIARKSDSAVWFRRNSHWSASGCCIVTLALAAHLGVQADLAALRFSYRERPVQHDLTTHFFRTTPDEDAGFLDAPVETFFDNKLFATTGRNTGSSYGLRNPSAPDPRRAIVFGDSYSYDVGFTFALVEVFAEVVFVWSKSIDWNLVQQHGSQVVIWESAERFLATLPQA